MFLMFLTTFSSTYLSRLAHCQSLLIRLRFRSIFAIFVPQSTWRLFRGWNEHDYLLCELSCCWDRRWRATVLRAPTVDPHSTLICLRRRYQTSLNPAGRRATWGLGHVRNLRGAHTFPLSCWCTLTDCHQCQPREASKSTYSNWWCQCQIWTAYQFLHPSWLHFVTLAASAWSSTIQGVHQSISTNSSQKVK